MWRRRLRARMPKSNRPLHWITVKVHQPEAILSTQNNCFSVKTGCNIAAPGSLPGFSALHEDIDSPRPSRHTKLKHSLGSGREVPMVLSEDLSTSLSSLHETMGRFGTDSSATGPFKISTSQKEMESS